MSHLVHTSPKDKPCLDRQEIYLLDLQSWLNNSRVEGTKGDVAVALVRDGGVGAGVGGGGSRDGAGLGVSTEERWMERNEDGDGEMGKPYER